MGLLFSNNASSTLAAPLLDSDTSLQVSAGDGAKFPVIVGELAFLLTIEDSVGNYEIVKCTARVGDVFTIVRAQEGTASRAFSIGAVVENRFTAGTMAGYAQTVDVQPKSAALTAISSAYTEADKVPYATAPNTVAEMTVTAAARALLDDTTVAGQRSTLELGSAALYNVGNSANNVIQLDANGKIPAGTDGSQLANLPDNSASCLGTFKNLVVSATGTDASISMSADEIIVEDSSHKYKTLRGLSLTASTSATGAGGLDTGTVASGTWYAVWLIYNSTTSTSALLLSLSGTSPTLPSDYTYKVRIGWIQTHATTNTYPYSFTQFGRNILLRIDAVRTVYTLVKSGNVSADIDVSTYIPTTAGAVYVGFFQGAADGLDGGISNAPYTLGIGANAMMSYLEGNSQGVIHDTLYIQVPAKKIYTYGNGNVTLLGWEDSI